MAQKRAAGKPEERRRGGARQNPEGQLKKRVETRNTPGPRAQWKPGNMIYPVPAVLVTVADCEGNSNIITIAWTGTICTNPPMAYISVRPERYSYHMLRESGEFVINLATESMAYATDYCGVRSGRNVDKWKETGLTPVPAQTVKAPVIAESPVSGLHMLTLRPIKTRSRFGSGALLLNLASIRNSPDRSTKSTRLHLNVLPQLVNTGFQVLFHSPPGVLFTFPSQYYALSVTK